MRSDAARSQLPDPTVRRLPGEVPGRVTIATTEGPVEVDYIERRGVWAVHTSHDWEGSTKPTMITHEPTGRLLAAIFGRSAARAAVRMIDQEYGEDLSVGDVPVKGASAVGGVGAMCLWLEEEGVLYRLSSEAWWDSMERAGL